MRSQITFACRAFLLGVSAYAVGATAQSSGGAYCIAPVAVASGGGTLSGGSFALSGTFGQAQASVLLASGYRLYGGIWAPASDVIFANDFDN